MNATIHDRITLGQLEIFLLRSADILLGNIDASVQPRVVPTPRATWIMESIAEKRGREQG